jgi:peptide/nickel transport system substrate-binding protein
MEARPEGIMKHRLAPPMSLLLLLAGFALASSVGCGSSGDAARLPAEAGEPVDGGTVVIGVFSEVDGFNEFVSTDANATDIMENLLFLPLLRWNEDLKLAPALASSWEFSEDRKVITLHLREDNHWHDGQPTTAEDVKFTFDRFVDPDLAYADAGTFRYLESVEVTGPYELKFTYSRTYADQLASLRKVVLPKHLLENVPSAEMESAGYNRNPVGNGPFRFARWKRAQSITFEANPDFPDGRPHLDRVIFRIIPDETAIFTSFQSGELDIIERTRYEQVGSLRADPRVEVHSRPQRGYQYVGWNSKRVFFEEAEVRQALTMSIDRQRIIDALVFGEGKVTALPVMSLSPIYDTSVQPYPYDPARARELLAKHGWIDHDGDGVLDKDGAPFAFTLTTNLGNQLREDTLVMIQDDLRKVGIAVTPQVREWSVFLDAIKSKDFDACHLAWQTDFLFDPYNIFHSEAIEGKYNFTSYGRPDVDRLITEATLAPNPETALPIWHEMLAIVNRDQPYSILFELVESTAFNGRIQGEKVDVRSYLINIPQWWIPADQRKYAS